MPEKHDVRDGYWLMGFQYEITGSLYSLGQIPKCKVAMLEHLKAGDTLLVAGWDTAPRPSRRRRKG